MIPFVDFEEVRRQVTVEKALALIGWQATWRKGVLARGWCPLHSAVPHPSRIFCITRDGYYCHRCHAHGDVIDLWSRLMGLPAPKAAEHLCGKLRLAVPRRPARR